MRGYTRHRSAVGVTVPELLVVGAMAAVMMGVSAPAVLSMRENARLNGAVMQVVSDLQAVRSRAVATGWQYRLVGFNAGAEDATRNRYRLLARRSSAVAWPEVTREPFETTTQAAGPWVDLGGLYPGVRFNPDDATPTFWVTFDGRGVPIELQGGISPLRIVGGQGARRSVAVSPVGGVRVE